MSLSVEGARRSPAQARVRLITTFAVRNLRARYTASNLGLLWALIVPLATVLIYSIVFSAVFRGEPPPMGNGRQGVYALWFFCGLVTWTTFAQGTNSALSSIIGMGPMMQKIYIPAYIPSASATLSVVMEKCLEAFVMLCAMAVYGNVGWTWLLYPFIFAEVAVFAASVGFVLAVAQVHFRDTAHMYSIVVQLMFFLTPVMYPLSRIPEQWNGIPLQSILSLNPLAGFVEISRDLVYSTQLPPLTTVMYGALWTTAVVALAVIVHRRWGRDVNEFV